MKHFISTASCRDFTYGDPGLTVSIQDVAHHLSHVARYAGATKFHYTVAQHAVGVCDLIRMAGGSVKMRRRGLHHDDHEAFMGDIPTPFSKWVAHAFLGGRDVISEAKDAIDGVVIPQMTGEEFPWNPAVSQYVEYFDKLMLVVEALQLFPEIPAWLRTYSEAAGIDYDRVIKLNYVIKRCSPEFARDLFLTKCEELTDINDDVEDVAERNQDKWIREFGLPEHLRTIGRY